MVSQVYLSAEVCNLCQLKYHVFIKQAACQNREKVFKTSYIPMEYFIIKVKKINANLL